MYWTQEANVQQVPSSLKCTVVCSIHVFLCMSCVIKNCIEQFKTEIWDSQNKVTFPWEEAMRVSMNIQLVRVGLVIIIDREHGIGMYHNTCLHRHTPVTWVGYIITYVNWCRLRKNTTMPCSLVCLCRITWDIILSFSFFLQLQLILMMRCKLCIYSWTRRSRDRKDHTFGQHFKRKWLICLTGHSRKCFHYTIKD